jgi:hypothetical protein
VINRPKTNFYPSLEDPEKVARGEVWRTKQKDGKDYPLVIFRFLYRSLGKYPSALRGILR